MNPDNDKSTSEGYVYVSYGDPKYLRHAVASIVSLKRYDHARPVALVCDEAHAEILSNQFSDSIADNILILDKEHQSITGFKHNIHHYMPFSSNLFLDSDMVWCKDPGPLWKSLSAYPFTITGNQISDHFFGAPKHLGVLKDILLRRRKRTLRRFGLTYLSRVQTGMIYASDRELAKKVCELAADYLSRIDETHFQSRKKEKGRLEESCEWSLAMAMSKLDIQVYPWMLGHRSPQVDFIESYTEYDRDFTEVTCLYYSDPFVYSLRGLTPDWLRKLLLRIFSALPGKGDYMMIKPYCLHFGWLHQKQPFEEFAERIWRDLAEFEIPAETR